MALTKQDLKDIKGIVKVTIDEAIDSFSLKVAQGFGQVQEQFDKVQEQFDKVQEQFDQVYARFDKIDKDIFDIKDDIIHIRAELRNINQRLTNVEQRTLEDDDALVSVINDLDLRLKRAEIDIKKIKLST